MTFEPVDEKMEVEDNDEYQDEQQDEEMDPDVEVLSQHGVSEETANMIKHKQDLEAEAKQRNEEMQEKEAHKRKIDEHFRVAEGMRSLFISRDKKGMW